jgi:hypothetical protein
MNNSSNGSGAAAAVAVGIQLSTRFFPIDFRRLRILLINLAYDDRSDLTARQAELAHMLRVNHNTLHELRFGGNGSAQLISDEVVQLWTTCPQLRTINHPHTLSKCIYYPSYLITHRCVLLPIIGVLEMPSFLTKVDIIQTMHYCHLLHSLKVHELDSATTTAIISRRSRSIDNTSRDSSSSSGSGSSRSKDTSGNQGSDHSSDSSNNGWRSLEFHWSTVSSSDMLALAALHGHSLQRFTARVTITAMLARALAAMSSLTQLTLLLSDDVDTAANEGKEGPAFISTTLIPVTHWQLPSMHTLTLSYLHRVPPVIIAPHLQLLDLFGWVPCHGQAPPSVGPYSMATILAGCASLTEVRRQTSQYPDRWDVELDLAKRSEYVTLDLWHALPQLKVTNMGTLVSDRHVFNKYCIYMCVAM